MNIPLLTYTLMYSIEISWVLKSSFKYEAIVLQATQVSMKKRHGCIALSNKGVHCTVKQGCTFYCQARLYIALSSKGVHCTVKQGRALHCQARACIELSSKAVHCTVMQGRALHCHARVYIVLPSKGVYCTSKQGRVLYG